MATNRSTSLVADKPAPGRVTAADFAALHRGDHCPLVENVAADRLRDFEAGDNLPAHTLGERIVGVPNNAARRTRAVLEEMTAVVVDATTYLDAATAFTSAKIKLATSRKRYDLENLRLDSAIAEEESKRAYHEALRAEHEWRAQTARTTPSRPTKRVARKKEPETETAPRPQAPPPPPPDRKAELERQLELEKLKKQIQTEQHAQQVADAGLEWRIAQLKDPDSARRFQEERAHARELERIDDELRQITNQEERDAHVQRALDAYVARARDLHGEESEAHQAAIDVADNYMRKFRMKGQA